MSAAPDTASVGECACTIASVIPAPSPAPRFIIVVLLPSYKHHFISRSNLRGSSETDGGGGGGESSSRMWAAVSQWTAVAAASEVRHTYRV